MPGVTLSAFIRSALEQKTGKRIRLWDFKKKLAETMELLAMDASYAERDLNVGFSGGEKKKAEILQMLMLEPKLAILDETDSGLDVDAVRTVSKGVQLYRERVHGSLLIITHSTRILEALTVDAAHIMEKGVIVKTAMHRSSIPSTKTALAASRLTESEAIRMKEKVRSRTLTAASMTSATKRTMPIACRKA